MLSADEYIEGIKKKNRSVFAQFLTLLEQKENRNQDVVSTVLKAFGESDKTWRIGITGPPGVGKSTFINAFGKLLAENKSLAVLAIDPSGKHGGSILGDKTRMGDLSLLENVFIRPSPSRGILGGVGHRTQDMILACEAFGPEVIFIETVGVGQSEFHISEMVDCLIVLTLPGSGDILQGMKKGLLEYADIIVVNKLDNNEELANDAYHMYKESTHLGEKSIPVVKTSSLNGVGLTEVLKEVTSLFEKKNLSSHRLGQKENWMRDFARFVVNEELEKNEEFKKILNGLKSQKLSFGEAEDRMSRYIKGKLS